MVTEPNASIYGNAINDSLSQYLKKLSDEGLSSMAVSMGYLMKQKVPTVPIISFRDEKQLNEAIEASFVTLDDEKMEILEELRNGKEK